MNGTGLLADSEPWVMAMTGCDQLLWDETQVLCWATAVGQLNAVKPVCVLGLLGM